MNDAPAQLYPFLSRDQLKFGNNAKLNIQVISQANAAIALDVVSVNREGISKFKHVTNSDGSQATTTHQVSDIPLAVSIVDTGGSFTQGDSYVTVRMLINGEVIFELCSGFVFKQKAISWPVNNTNDSMPGRGRIKVITLADPGAGNPVILTVPTGRIYKILAVRAQHVTDATVANRQNFLKVEFTSGIQLSASANAVQAASLTRHYSWAQYGAISASVYSSFIESPLPADLYLPAGLTLTLDGTFNGGGDVYTNARAIVEEIFV